jgi:hypothetical protein
LMLMFVKTGNLVLLSFMKFSHMFWDLSSTRLSQFNSDTEKFVPDGFQECSQMSSSSYGLIKWTGGWLLWLGDCQACAMPGQMPESRWELHRKINILSRVGVYA